MKRLILFLSIFFICTQANAEKYAIENSDGSIAIMNYIPGSSDTLEDALLSRGQPYLRVVPIKESEIPKGETNKFFKLNGNKLEIDSVKKQADIDKKAQEEADKEAVLAKLKITQEEFEKIKGK